MKFTTTALAVAAVGAAAVAAQNETQSLCDKYTVAKLMNNTSENQLTLLTLLVNTVVAGNFSDAADGSYVAGILADGTAENASGDEKPVSLLQYFNGSLLSSNRDGKPTAVNFLDGGAGEALVAGKPADDDKQNSNQYTLMTHLYQVFGVLLGCSMMGDGMAFPAYQGSTDMYAVHQFMNLNVPETTYFVNQVGAAAKSFGVSNDDITTVANALTTTFNYRCAAASALAAGAPPASQSICVASSCPIANGSTCDGVQDSVEPQAVGATDSTSSSSSSSGPTGSSSSTAPSATNTRSPDSAVGMILNTVGAVALAGGAIAAAALF